MSLINLTPINEQSINNVKTTIAKEENDDSRLREELSDDEDDLEHETSISSVQVCYFRDIRLEFKLESQSVIKLIFIFFDILYFSFRF